MPTNIPAAFFQSDVEITRTPSSSIELSQITMLAEQQLHYQQEIAELEAQLKEANQKLTNLAERSLPELMMSVGLTEFVLNNGFKVTIKEDVFASIRKDCMDGAVAWFDKCGLGDIVKDEVKIQLGKGEAELAAKFLLLAEDLGVPATEKLSVHAGTLKSIAKEQLARGVEFPEEYFSVYPFKRAEIKPYKEKAARGKKQVSIPAPTAPVTPNNIDFEDF